MKKLIQNKMLVGVLMGMIIGCAITCAFGIKNSNTIRFNSSDTTITNSDGTPVTDKQLQAFDSYGTLMTNSEGIPMKTGHR